MRNTILFLAALGLSGSLFAGDPVNTNLWGVAVKGYDVTAYFTESKPVKGDKEFKLKWNDATWYFQSAANRDMFGKNPEKYAPQYGGYCAWAVSQGSTANIDPTAWKIVDGKLYLNYNHEIQQKWEADIPGFIKKADVNWPKVAQ